MERLTIDQAIAHAQEVAETRTDLCDECRQEHEQLAKWLTKLKAYNDAEQDGRLVELPPVKIGDTAFFIINNHIFGGTVYFMSWEHHKSFGIRGHIYADCAVGTVSASLFDFGKTVFLTREEAEAALKGGAE